MSDNSYQVGDTVLTPTMGEGEVVGVHEQFVWVLIRMVDGTLIPSTYKSEILERGTWLTETRQ